MVWSLMLESKTFRMVDWKPRSCCWVVVIVTFCDMESRRPPAQPRGHSSLPREPACPARHGKGTALCPLGASRRSSIWIVLRIKLMVIVWALVSALRVSMVASLKSAHCTLWRLNRHLDTLAGAWMPNVVWTLAFLVKNCSIPR